MFWYVSIPRVYGPPCLCSTTPLFHPALVPPCLCLFVSIFQRVYVLMCLYSPCLWSTFSVFHYGSIPLCPCSSVSLFVCVCFSIVSMFHGVYIPLCLCSSMSLFPASMVPRVCVRLRLYSILPLILHVSVCSYLYCRQKVKEHRPRQSGSVAGPW